MNEASKFTTAEIVDAPARLDADLDSRSRLGLYFAVGLGAGSVIALQIDIMRVFSVGSWAHFGSLVVSLAMLGFGLASATMVVAKDWFARNWRAAATVSLALFGPLAVGANLYVQHLGFNAIFLVSDPAQKWKLLADFPGGADAVPGRRVFPRVRLPQEQSHVRARLFRRPRRGGALRPCVSAGDVRAYARQFDRGAVGALVRGLSRLGVRAGRARRARSISGRRRPCVRWTFRACRRRLA